LGKVASKPRVFRVCVKTMVFRQGTASAVPYVEQNQ
jgi:hypothetical protein